MYSATTQLHLLAVLLVAYACTSAIRMANWTGDHSVKAARAQARDCGAVGKHARPYLRETLALQAPRRLELLEFGQIASIHPRYNPLLQMTWYGIQHVLPSFGCGEYQFSYELYIRPV